MPGEPPATAGSKSSSKAKRISIPRVQSSTDTELQSQQSQSGSTPLQPTALHYVTFRSELEDSPIPSAVRCRLYDLFQQIEKEFEMLYTENLGCKYFLWQIQLVHYVRLVYTKSCYLYINMCVRARARVYVCVCVCVCVCVSFKIFILKYLKYLF